MIQAQICLAPKMYFFPHYTMLPPKAKKTKKQKNMNVEKGHILVKQMFLLAWFTHFKNVQCRKGSQH